MTWRKGAISFGRLGGLGVCLWAVAFLLAGCCGSSGGGGEGDDTGADDSDSDDSDVVRSAGSDDFDEPSTWDDQWNKELEGAPQVTVTEGKLTIDLTGVPPPEDGGPVLMAGKRIMGDCEIEVAVSDSNHDEEGEVVYFFVGAGWDPDNPSGGGLVGFGMIGSMGGYSLWDNVTGPLNPIEYNDRTIWFRMRRSGTNFTTWVSSDGLTWTELSPVQTSTANPGETVVGFFVNSGGGNNDFQVVLEYFRFLCGGIESVGDSLPLIPCE